jgi:hypothetical protein
MFHITLFGGTEGVLPVSDFVSLTMFGGTELVQPTLAQRILRLRESRRQAPSVWRRIFQLDKNVIVTVFGATEIYAPTLMDEYADLKRVLSSGILSADEGRQLLAELADKGGAHDLFSAITLFGGCSIEVPKAAEERKALEAGRQAGLIGDKEHAVLDRVIGRSESAIAAALGELAFAAR